MKKLPLGKTGEQVSALCLGAMYYGSSVKEEMACWLLDQYVDRGGTFIDTANIYAWWIEGFHGGESETVLGRWMKERKNRDRLFIASKVGFGYGDVQVGLSARQIETECEKSLRRMGIEAFDLYYAHVDDANTPLDETLQAFNRLVAAGKVRYLGASNFRAWRLEQAHCISQAGGLAEYCCVQQRYTYLQPRAGTGFGAQLAANDDLLDYCRRRGLTLLAYSPLLSGAYTRAERPLSKQYQGEDNRQRLSALREVAASRGAATNQVILAWMRQSDPPVVPVFSASTPEQMDEDLGALDLLLSEEEMTRLNQAGTQ
jgi:aryl-alcohol dehydrogenase-like predicted oxidoreductase